MQKTIHQGKNVKRFREMMDVKQETVAEVLGDDWTQKKVSLLESKEKIDQELLERLSKVIGVPVRAFTDFDETVPLNFVGNTVTTVSDHGVGFLNQFNPIINPVEEWVKALDKKDELVQTVIQQMKEQIDLLKALLNLKDK